MSAAATAGGRSSNARRRVPRRGAPWRRSLPSPHPGDALDAGSVRAGLTATGTDRTGIAIAALAALGWFGLSYVRFRNYHAGASDLGIFDQASWLMAHGHAPLITSIGINVFADHVSPVLLVFVPLYRLAATPVWLLAAQAVCLGLTVVPLRKLADELAVPRWLPTIAVILSAPLLNAAVYDVHPVVFATPAVAWALLASRRGDLRQLTFAGLAVALCRADAVTALVGIAVVSSPVVRRRLLWVVPPPLVASVLIPRWLGTWQTFDRYYPHLGTGWPDALAHPWRIVTALVGTGSLHQLGWWLLPVGFLPVLRPRWLLALIVAGFPLLASSWPGITVPWYHHSAFLVPLAVAGALHGWAWLSALERPSPRGLRAAAGAIAVVGITTALATSSPAARRAPETVRLDTVMRRAPRPIMAAIGAVRPGEGVSAQNGVLGHLGHRQDAFIWPCPFPADTGGRSCGHQGLLSRRNRVDVVVLVGRADTRYLRALGFRRIARRDGVTVARRSRR